MACRQFFGAVRPTQVMANPLRDEGLARMGTERRLCRGIPVAMCRSHVAARCRGSINPAAPPHIRTARRASANSSGEDLMSMLINYVKSFARQEEGQDLLEYALLVALIALVAIVAVTAAGDTVSNIFTQIAGELGGAA
jgi:pilus assembly protein Flp/PilA